MAKDLRDSEEYRAEAARLKAKGDAVKSVASSIGSFIFTFVAFALIATLLFIVIHIFLSRKEAAEQAEARIKRSQELSKLVVGKNTSEYCYRNLDKDECLNLYFIEDDAGHMIIQDKVGYHLFKQDKNGFIESADEDFSSNNPLDYATLYPKNLTNKPWLEAFEFNGKIFKLKSKQ